MCVWLQVYSESVIPRIAKAASGVTGTPYNELMNSWGVYFLGFVGKYGYDRILKVENYPENCIHFWELLKKSILLNMFSLQYLFSCNSKAKSANCLQRDAH